MSEVFFEKVFVTRPWKALFVTTDDDIHEWWFRLNFKIFLFVDIGNDMEGVYDKTTAKRKCLKDLHA